MGLEDRTSSAANIAGYLTIGTLQGLAIIVVPIFVVGIGAGFLRKVVRIGARLGGQ